MAEMARPCRLIHYGNAPHLRGDASVGSGFEAEQVHPGWHHAVGIAAIPTNLVGAGAIAGLVKAMHRPAAQVVHDDLDFDLVGRLEQNVVEGDTGR